MSQGSGKGKCGRSLHKKRSTKVIEENYDKTYLEDKYDDSQSSDKPVLFISRKPNDVVER